MGTPCSIVVRCRDEEKHIARLLAGIVDQQGVDPQVILVDSGSCDATLDIAQDHHRVEILHLDPADFSFGRALNIGCQVASHDLIVFASAHVYPTSTDWLQKLLRPLLDEPRVGATYGLQRGNELTRFSEHRIFEQTFPEEPSSLASERPFCHNANAAIRRSLWQEIPYDEDLPGLEDLAWALEIEQHDFKTRYVPEAAVIHVHEERPAQIYRRYHREAVARTSLLRRRASLRQQTSELLTGLSSDLQHARRTGTLLANLRCILEFRLMQHLGTYRGSRHKNAALPTATRAARPAQLPTTSRANFPTGQHETPCG